MLSNIYYFLKHSQFVENHTLQAPTLTSTCRNNKNPYTPIHGTPILYISLYSRHRSIKNMSCSLTLSSMLNCFLFVSSSYIIVTFPGKLYSNSFYAFAPSFRHAHLPTHNDIKIIRIPIRTHPTRKTFHRFFL